MVNCIKSHVQLGRLGPCGQRCACWRVLVVEASSSTLSAWHLRWLWALLMSGKLLAYLYCSTTSPRAVSPPHVAVYDTPCFTGTMPGRSVHPERMTC